MAADGYTSAVQGGRGCLHDLVGFWADHWPRQHSTCSCPLADVDVPVLARLEELVDKLRVCAEHHLEQLL